MPIYSNHCTLRQPAMISSLKGYIIKKRKVCGVKYLTSLSLRDEINFLRGEGTHNSKMSKLIRDRLRLFLLVENTFVSYIGLFLCNLLLNPKKR